MPTEDLTADQFIQLLDSLTTLTTDRKKAIMQAILENQANDDIRNELQNALLLQMELLKREEKMLQEDYDAKTKEYVELMQQLSEEHAEGLQKIVDEASAQIMQVENEINALEDDITKTTEDDQLAKVRASLAGQA